MGELFLYNVRYVWKGRSVKMNKRFFIFLMFFISCVAYSQWEIQNSGVSVYLRDICFVDSLYGWAVGDSGIVIATKDGGKTWIKMIELSDSVEFKQVQFLNREIGFVGGNTIKKFPTYTAFYVLLLRTMNGGFSWERCDSMFSSDLTFGDMQFLDPDNGWIGIKNIGANSIADRKGILLKTKDGGKSWSVLQEKDSLLVGAVAFWNNSIGYSFWSFAIDNFNNTEVYCTQNAGLEWTRTGTIREEVVKKAKCISSNTIWTIGYKTSRSNNGGQTWNSWNWFSPVIGGQKRFIASDFEIFNSDNIWLVGNAFSNPFDNEGVILNTRNSGETWFSELQIPNRHFKGLSVVSNKKAWIAGSNGLIMHLKNIVTVIDKEVEAFPKQFEIEQNYPNPFNPSTQIEFQIPKYGFVSLTIFDLLGREVITLLNEEKKPGMYTVTWNGKDKYGKEVSSGIYFYKLRAGSFSRTQKMIFIN